LISISILILVSISTLILMILERRRGLRATAGVDRRIRVRPRLSLLLTVMPTPSTGCRPPAAAAREDAPPGPQGLWKKAVCAAIIVALTLFPAFYLLLFGVQQGKAMLKVWWISSMTSFALTAVFYEVVWRLMKRQSQRLTMPHEPASLVTVSLPPLFPLHSLHSRGSRSRSSSNSCCCRPCSGARSSSSPTQLSSCDSRSARRRSMKAQ